MSRIIRWDPFHELRQVMNTWPAMDMDDDYALPLAIDVSEDADNVYIVADLPGFNPDDVDITVTADQVTIKAEQQEETKEEGKNYLRRERRYGQLSRTIALPTPVVSEDAEADFDNGKLTLMLPKVEEVRPKQVKIKAKIKDEN